MDETHLRFGGIERLLGKKALETLRSSKVLIVGLGGVGSWAVEALARSGLGHIGLMDFDDICLSNTNRQIHTLNSSVGRLKTQVLAERVHGIDPNIEVRTIEHPFSQKTVDMVFPEKWDLIIDAIDSLDAKCQLIQHAWQTKTKLITTGGSGGKTDPTLIQVKDLNKSHGDPLLQKTRKKLRQVYGLPRGRAAWNIPCVFSCEAPHLPLGECPSGPLDCSSGLGAASFLTGSFGFAAAWKAVDMLTK